MAKKQKSKKVTEEEASKNIAEMLSKFEFDEVLFSANIFVLGISNIFSRLRKNHYQIYSDLMQDPVISMASRAALSLIKNDYPTFVKIIEIYQETLKHSS